MQVLHSFAGGVAGASPYEAPIEGDDGYYYGTTGGGGAFDAGTIYRMDRSGTVTILHSFGETEDAGAAPVGEIVQGEDGALYGTTAGEASSATGRRGAWNSNEARGGGVPRRAFAPLAQPFTKSGETPVSGGLITRIRTRRAGDE